MLSSPAGWRPGRPAPRGRASLRRDAPRPPRGRRRPRPTARRSPRFSFVENTSSQTDLRVAFRAASERDPREPAVEMLMRVLDDGMSTRLYERICDRLGLCYDVSGMFEAYEDDGVLDVAAGAQHERAVQVTKEIFALLHEPRHRGPHRRGARQGEGPAPLVRRGDARRCRGRGGLLRPRGARRASRGRPAARHEDLARVTGTRCARRPRRCSGRPDQRGRRGAPQRGRGAEAGAGGAGVLIGGRRRAALAASEAIMMPAPARPRLRRTPAGT